MCLVVTSWLQLLSVMFVAQYDMLFSVMCVAQCAVRAAIHGRVLVLEGIEKAERNVLPVLNNLLENREMQLDDGRFLMAAERYDKLLQVIVCLCDCKFYCTYAMWLMKRN